MVILLAAKVEGGGNQYVGELANAYQKSGHVVIVGAQNFVMSALVPDVLHIQWPEAIYFWEMRAPRNGLTLEFLEERLKFYKATGKTTIVLTMHNLLPHDSKAEFDFKAYSLFIKYADIVAHHGEKSISMAKEIFPELANVDNIICPHGPYKTFALEKAKACEGLGLPRNLPIILIFGRIKNYKGGGFVKRVFRGWDSDCIVCIAGHNNPPKLYQKLMVMLSIKLRKWMNFGKFRYMYSRKVLSEREVGTLFSACDLVFLGHTSGLNSGVVTLAASYQRPVVFPDLGNFNEQLDGWKWKKAFMPGDVSSARKALDDMLKLSNSKQDPAVMDNSDWLKLNSWDLHVQRIEVAVRRRIKKGS